MLVTKDDGVTTAQPGQTLTYTLTIRNAGNQDATGVRAGDAIPGNTTFVDASNGGSFANGAVTWIIGDLAAGASVTRTVRVRINDTVPTGVTSITNAAAVSDDGTNGPDPTPENNTAFDTDALNAAPDLSITKDDALTVVTPGQTVTYTLVVSNVGNQAPTAIRPRTPPGGQRYSSNGTVLWDPAPYAGATKTVTVTVNDRCRRA